METFDLLDLLDLLYLIMLAAWGWYMSGILWRETRAEYDLPAILHKGEQVEPRSRLAACNSCGAPRSAHKCSYCGTEET